MKHLSKSSPEGPKLGLALGSGASRGWSHIGVIKALERMGLKPHVVTGCSIGAIVGAAYAAGNLQILEDWVLSLGKREVAGFFDLNWRLNGLINAGRLRAVLAQYVAAEEILIESLDTEFATVSTDLASGREIWFTDGKVLDAIMPSIALPGLFVPVHRDNRWLVDGGLVNPVPVSLCHALGAELVIAVNLNGDIVGKHLAPKKREQNSGNEALNNIIGVIKGYSNNLFDTVDKPKPAPGLMDIVASAINITQDRITRSRMAGDPPDILLAPQLARIGLLEFDRAAETIAEGEQCVERMKPAIEFAVRRL